MTVRDGSVPVGTATVDSAGAWSLALAADLADGLHNLTATATDAAGNTSPSSPALALLIDTAAPAAPAGLALDPGSDSGTKGDGVTNIAAPVLVGAAEPGSTVTLFDGGAGLGSALANGAGQWSFTSPGLIEGAHSLSATATDVAGNVSSASAPFVLKIDTAAPSSPSSPRLASASDSGTKGDGVTAVARPVLAGTAEAGSTVTVFDGNAQIGTAVADNAGAWSLALAADLAEGIHQLTAAATDAASNASSSSAAFSLIIDATAPAAPSMPVLDPGSDSGTEGDGVTAIVTPTLTGTAEAGSLVTLIDAAGGATLGTATADGVGRWSFTSPALPDGAHDIAAFATDAAGNVSPTSPALALIIDTAAPAAPDGLALDPASDSGIGGDGLTNVAAPVLIGTAEAGSMIAVFGDGARLGDATAGPDGRWSFTSPGLTDGPHTITATATDVAGNVSNASSALEITIDTAAPPPPSPPALSSDSDTGTKGDGITAVRRPVLVGAAEADSTVTVFDGPAQLGVATADGSGAWNLAVTADLAEGVHAVSVTATDAAGNVSAASSVFSLAIDTTAPVPPPAPALDRASDSGTEGDGVTSASRPTFVGAAEAGSAVTLIDDTGTGRTALGTTIADGTGRWSFDSPTLADGPHTITAISADTAGNASAASPPLALSIDTAAPAAPSGLALDPASDSGVKGDGLTNIANPVITGTAEPGSTVTVLDGDPGVQLGTVQADSAGRWSFGSPALSEGGHSITAVATDAAGNASQASSPFLLTIDGTQLRITAALLRDSGASAVDGTTSDPTLIGTSEAGSVITLSEDGDNLGTATVDSAGRWAILPLGIGDGAHTITASGVDAAGNAGTAQVSFVLDATAPASPTSLALAPASDTGIRGDGITNAVRPVITGVAEPGSVVALFDAGSQIGAVAAGADGAWSITADLMNDGDHPLVATATDAAGNVSSTSALFNLTIDTAAPASSSIPVLDAASDTGTQGDGITAIARPAIAGTAEPGSTVTITDGGTALGSAVADSAGRWALTPAEALSDGVHALAAFATDAAGNVSAESSALDVVIDTIPPEAPSTPALDPASDTGQPGDGITANSRPVLSGTAEPGSMVALSEGTGAGAVVLGTAAADQDGQWSFASSTFAEGRHELFATATDLAGNTSLLSSPFVLTIDTAAPAAPGGIALDPASDSGTKGDDTTAIRTPLIAGIAEPGSVIALTDADGTAVGQATADSGGAWSVNTIPLSDGTHAIAATATDRAGNVSPASEPLELVIDGAAPAAPSTPRLALASDTGEPGDGITSQLRPVLTGQAEPGTVITIMDQSGPAPRAVGSTQADAGGLWSATLAILSDGHHALAATATDAAGNISALSGPLLLLIDSSMPRPPDGLALDPASDTGEQGDGITSSTAPTITGQADAGSVVTISDEQDGQARVLGTAQADSAGRWTFTADALTDGLHSIAATATNRAGTTSASSARLPLTISSTPPAAPTDLLIDAGSDSGAVGDGITNASALILSGAATAGAAIAVLDAGQEIGRTRADADGRWLLTTPILAEGRHAITATATSAAGVVSPASSPFQLLIDRTPPLLTAALARDTGTSDADGITSDPTLTGTGEAGCVVLIAENGGVLGQAAVGSDGRWTFTPPALPDGTRDLVMSETDAAGNMGVARLAAVLDTSPPQAPAGLVLASGSRSDPANATATSDRSIVIQGTAEPNAGITLLDGSVLAGTALADESGAWSVATQPLAEGRHAFTATATDAAGNISATSDTSSIDVDSTAPAAPSFSGLADASDSAAKGDRLTNVATPTLFGEAEPESLVAFIDRRGGDVVALGNTRADDQGRWSFTIPVLAEGGHGIIAASRDAAGNVSKVSDVFDLTIDTVPPPPPSSPGLARDSDSGDRGDGVTNVAQPVLTGTAEPGGIVVVRDGTGPGAIVLGTATADQAGRWTLTSPALANGRYAITATTTDAAGNVSAASATSNLTIILGPVRAPRDLALAEASDSGDRGDGITNVRRPVLTGTAAAGAAVAVTIMGVDGTVTTSSTTAGVDGMWAVEAPELADGDYTVRASATDQAGNASPASAPLALNIRSAPPPPISVSLANDTGLPGDGITSDATLTGSTIPGGLVTVREGAALLGSTRANAGGRWTFGPASLADGSHEIVASATDVAGNVGSGRLRFVITPTPPDETSSPTPSETNYTLVSGSGSSRDGLLDTYQGTVPGITRQFVYAGQDDATIVAHVPGVLLKGGGGTDALVVQSGRNVLDGGAGSSWLIGGTGQDSFVVDTRGGTWSTLIGFKAGDDATLRGIGGEGARYYWDGVDGQGGQAGATMRGVGAGAGGQGFAVTFAGLTVEQAKRYSAVVRTAEDGAPELRLVADDPASPAGATYVIKGAADQGYAADTLDAYQGPVGGLRYQHIEAGDADVIVVAQASDAFLRTGAGTDALVARNGDNILDGGSGSNWLVGGAGQDTFFVDMRGGLPVWNTLVNFHAGDALTIWGYQPDVSSWGWTTAAEGAGGFEGATLRGSINGGGVDYSVTLAGIDPVRARALAVSSGVTSDGQSYLHVQA